MGVKLKIGIFPIGRMKKIQMVEILHRGKTGRMKRTEAQLSLCQGNTIGATEVCRSFLLVIGNLHIYCPG